MYFPQSRILENQSSTGDFQIKSTGATYTGPYCKLSSGKFFTGETFTNNSLEIVEKPKSIGPISTVSLSNLGFSRLIQTNRISTQIQLKASIIKPTQEDYTKGSYIRYFATDTTSKLIKIFEINNNDYTSISNRNGKYFDLYKVINLEWKITGPLYDDLSKNIYGIIDTNTRTLNIKEKEMPGITIFFNGRLSEFGLPK